MNRLLLSIILLGIVFPILGCSSTSLPDDLIDDIENMSRLLDGGDAKLFVTEYAWEFKQFESTQGDTEDYLKRILQKVDIDRLKSLLASAIKSNSITYQAGDQGEYYKVVIEDDSFEYEELYFQRYHGEDRWRLNLP